MKLTVKHGTKLAAVCWLALGLWLLGVAPLTTHAQAPALIAAPNITAPQITAPPAAPLQNTATFSQSGIVLAELHVHHEMCNYNANDPLVYVGAGERIIWKNSLSAPTKTLLLIGYAAAGTPHSWRLGQECHYYANHSNGQRQEWDCDTWEWPCVSITAYVVPLPACHEGCAICQCSAGQAADPVDTWTGAFTHHETDFVLPTLGPALTFERTYNSARYTKRGALGYGWTHPYATYLTISDTHILFHAPRGSVLTYTRTAPRRFSPRPMYGRNWTPWAAATC